MKLVWRNVISEVRSAPPHREAFFRVAFESSLDASSTFEIVCITLRIGDCDDGVKQAIATKIIDLAKAGERNPDILCEQALKEIRTPRVCLRAPPSRRGG